MHNFTDALDAVLREEGGFVEDGRDPGGATNLGVTAHTWHAWSGKPASRAVMRRLTPAIVAPMYKAWFWDKVGGDTLPDGLALVLFDFAVNAGPACALGALEGVVGAKTTGRFGLTCKRAIDAYIAAIGLTKLIIRLCDARRDHYGGLPTFPVFGKGWMARVDRIQAKALSWVG